MGMQLLNLCIGYVFTDGHIEMDDHHNEQPCVKTGHQRMMLLIDGGSSLSLATQDANTGSWSNYQPIANMASCNLPATNMQPEMTVETDGMNSQFDMVRHEMNEVAMANGEEPEMTVAAANTTSTSTTSSTSTRSSSRSSTTTSNGIKSALGMSTIALMALISLFE